MKKLENEKVILTSNNDKIILTDHRIHMKVKDWGIDYSIGIFLEDISSIEVKYKSSLILLLAGIISIVGSVFYGLSENQRGILVLGLILGLILLAFWWFSRQHIVSISSNGGAKLNFSIQGFEAEKVEDFVWKVSQAKVGRVRNF
jgi:hypothetical protein